MTTSEEWPEDLKSRYRSICDKHMRPPHQLDGVRWMVNREFRGDISRPHKTSRGIVSSTIIPASSVRGGILADDMGIGKTHQTAGLIGVLPVSMTLIVTQKSIVMHWRSVVQRVTGILPMVLVGSSSGGHSGVSVCHRLKEADASRKKAFVAITTYGILTAHGRSSSLTKRPRKPCSPDSCIFERFWDRVILDEGHVIRNRSTQTFQAVSRLQSMRRWILTATPINNGAADMHSLLQWLGASKSDIESVVLRRTVSVATAPAPARHDADHSELPELHCDVVRMKFEHDVERRVYEIAERMLRRSARRAETERQSTSSLTCAQGTQSEVMRAMLRCRQACVHPVLCRDSVVRTRFCTGSVEDTADEDERELLVVSANARNLASTKIRYVRDRIAKAIEEDPETKAVVFCEWIYEMRMISHALRERDVSCVDFHGQLQLCEREGVLRDFSTQPDITVLLAQIRCGGTGLNLQAASLVIITSPSWNPCTELQAIGRAHRSGQVRDVTVERLVIEGTVEEQCIRVQDTKIDIIVSVLGEAADEEEPCCDAKRRRLLTTRQRSGILKNTDDVPVRRNSTVSFLTENRENHKHGENDPTSSGPFSHPQPQAI